ncbi:type II toxin-antitoxin system RelE/ParE family toxin [Allochromatium humboldtianum]|nr:type II toxin-antitoxin system RelE/ParE family toxin [Allochromatium humboldtianum]
MNVSPPEALPVRTDIDTLLRMNTPILDVRFFASDSGNEPVRDWLKSLPASERRTIGEDIKTVQFGWPLGMPLVRKLAKDLWEVRVHLADRIARILFTVVGHTMVLLHGFIKKSQTTPPEELDVAKRRLQHLRSAS